MANAIRPRSSSDPDSDTVGGSDTAAAQYLLDSTVRLGYRDQRRRRRRARDPRIHTRLGAPPDTEAESRRLGNNGRVCPGHSHSRSIALASSSFHPARLSQDERRLLQLRW